MSLQSKIEKEFKHRFTLKSTDSDEYSIIYTFKDFDGDEFSFIINSNSAIHEVIIINELQNKVIEKRIEKINLVIGNGH